MREHRETVSKGGRPAWLDKAYEQARRSAWMAGYGQRPDQIEVREEHERGRLVRLVAESRHDLVVPSALKNRLKAVFVKSNTELLLGNDAVQDIRGRGQVLVLVFKEPQNGIRGLPVTPAAERKLRKEGFTHLVISAVPKAARTDIRPEARTNTRYDEGGFWIGFYKPKGGHTHDGEKGGELVQDFQSELFVLQYLTENDLLALYEMPILTSWDFLPKSDAMREKENQIRFAHGCVGALHNEHSFQRARLIAHLSALYEEGASDEAELKDKVNKAFAATVVGKSEPRVERASTTRRYFVADDNSLAYALDNGSDGQYVVKVDLRDKTIDVSLVRQGLNGLPLMDLYDGFLTSPRFHEIDADTFHTLTDSIQDVDLRPTAA